MSWWKENWLRQERKGKSITKNKEVIFNWKVITSIEEKKR